MFILTYFPRNALSNELFGSNTADALALGQAHAVTASTSPYHAAFANPAALIKEENTSVATSFGVAKDFIRINRQSSTQPTYISYNLAVSARLAFPAPVSDRFYLGVQVHIPHDGLYQLELPKEDDIVPLFYGKNQRRTSIYAALGVRLWERLSVGIGVSVLPTIAGSVNIDFQTQDSNNRVDIGVKVSFAPTAALFWDAQNGFKIGLSYRAAHHSSIKIPVNVHISENLPSVYTRIDGTAFGSPHSITLGAAYNFASVPLGLSLDVAYDIYTKPILSSPQVTLFDSEGHVLQEALPPSFSLQNRFVARAALAYSPLPSLSLTTGYAFYQSPVLAQRLTSNLIDTHTHRIALGAQYRHTFNPKFAMHVSAALATDLLQPRHVQKWDFLPQNPGFPSLHIGGWALSSLFSVSLHFR